MVRYSFLVGLFHPRLHAGLCRRLRMLTHGGSDPISMFYQELSERCTSFRERARLLSPPPPLSAIERSFAFARPPLV